MPKLRIERIIEVKEKFMDDKRKEMEIVVSKIDRITLKIKDTDNSIEENYNSITGRITDSNDMYVIKEYIIYLENKKLEMLKERENLNIKMQTIKSELIELMKEVKMMEILKSKELQIIKKSQNRKEQKMLDELAARINEIK